MTEDRFSAPEGFEWGTFKNARGAEIRYGHIKAPGESKGIDINLTGFRESIEKYFEVVRDLLAQGLDVWTMDWRDQGGSERYLKDTPQKSHSEGFDEQIDTLRQFAEKIVQNPGNKPMFMTAHSMGAHIGLRYLHDHPKTFDAAILTAPMFNVPTGKIPRLVAEALASFYVRTDSEKYTADKGKGDWSELGAVFDGNDKSGDRARFDASNDIYRRNPHLRKGAATFGWLYHAFESIRILNNEKYLKEIRTPILMETSGDDKIVLTDAQDRAITLLPDCTRFSSPAAKHEIWSETDALRGAWLKAVNNFISTRLTIAADKKAKGPKP